MTEKTLEQLLATAKDINYFDVSDRLKNFTLDEVLTSEIVDDAYDCMHSSYVTYDELSDYFGTDLRFLDLLKYLATVCKAYSICNCYEEESLDSMKYERAFDCINSAIAILTDEQ